MKPWIVRLGSLYVFNVGVLLVIGWILPTVQVGFHALWAAIVLTVATVWVKPVIGGWLRTAAARRGGSSSRGTEKLVEYVIVFAIALVVWFLVVLLSGVNVDGWFWGYVLPPALLLVAWAIYDVIDDGLEKRAGDLYDRATGATAARESVIVDEPTPQQRAATEVGREELRDGLTPEQRKMFDGL